MKESCDAHFNLRDGSMTVVSDSIKDLAHHVHPPVPNPAPLGLIAFGLTTALLQLKHTRITDDGEGVDIVVMGFAMFFGGLLQVCIPCDAWQDNTRRSLTLGLSADCRS